MFKDYNLEDMEQSGTNMEELQLFCAMIDRNTYIKKFDYTDCMILHYLKKEDKTGKLFCLKIVPGRRTYLQDIRGIPHVLTPDIGVMSAGRMNKIGAGNLLKCLERNRTVFYFKRDGGSEFIFASKAMRRTMGARLPVTDPEPCVERDLLLAKKIGDSDYPMEYYTILRGNRNYYLGIGLFYREPKRTSWEEVCRFISENGSGKNLIWHADQTNGLRVMYQYENETQAIEETFPKCRLSPIHIFVTCDSGAVADLIASAWSDPENPSTFFISGIHKVKNSWETAYEESINQHISDASVLSSGNTPISSKEEWVSRLIETASKAEMKGIVGASAQSSFLGYASKLYQDGMTCLDLKMSVVVALKDGIFQKASPYMDRMARERGIWTFIQKA